MTYMRQSNTIQFVEDPFIKHSQGIAKNLLEAL